MSPQYRYYPKIAHTKVTMSQFKMLVYGGTRDRRPLINKLKTQRLDTNSKIRPLRGSFFETSAAKRHASNVMKLNGEQSS